MMLETRQLQKEEVIPYDLLLLADETLEAIDRYINDSEIYVLEREDSVVAIYVLQKISQESMEIKNIAVAERLQGRGIGKFLLQDAIVIESTIHFYQSVSPFVPRMKVS